MDSLSPKIVVTEKTLERDTFAVIGAFSRSPSCGGLRGL